MGTCKSFAIRADRPMYIHADGEVFTSFGSHIQGIKFEIQPGALQIVCG